jgi:hypothetical protein
MCHFEHKSINLKSFFSVFIDMSFLEQKQRILEQQQELQRQKQQEKKYAGYCPYPQFNRPN